MFTRPFEEQVAYLAQRMDKTGILGLMGIAWYTVGSIAARVVARMSPDDRLAGLRVLGIDELSYRRHHKYVTIITDHDTGKVVWAREGKNADTLNTFFAELGPERCAKLATVTLDMSQAYIGSVKANAPQAEIVFDRFHVQRLAHDALDQVRRALVAKHTEPQQRQVLKKTRFVLQKNPENLSSAERQKLAAVQANNRPLYRAYLLKDTLASILDRRQYYVARAELHGRLAWASRSKLAPFVRVARTIHKHLHGILAYLNTRQMAARWDSTASPRYHQALVWLTLCQEPHRYALPVLLAPRAHTGEGSAEYTPTRVLGEPVFWAARPRDC
jgi:transposase